MGEERLDLVGVISSSLRPWVCCPRYSLALHPLLPSWCSPFLSRTLHTITGTPPQSQPGHLTWQIGAVSLWDENFPEVSSHSREEIQSSTISGFLSSWGSWWLGSGIYSQCSPLVSARHWFQNLYGISKSNMPNSTDWHICK